jgi:hypothetical protein
MGCSLAGCPPILISQFDLLFPSESHRQNTHIHHIFYGFILFFCSLVIFAIFTYTSRVHITTVPSNADILINNQFIAKTPYTFESAKLLQWYDLELQKDGYKSQRMRFRAAFIDKRLIIPLTPSFGNLSVESTPEADVYLGPTCLGTTPILNYHLDAGSYTLQIVTNPPNSLIRKRKVEILAGESKKITESFDGYLLLTSPFKGSVFVDEKYLGNTIKRQSFRLLGGEHKIKLLKNGYILAQKTLEIVPGQKTVLDIPQRGYLDIKTTPAVEIMIRGNQEMKILTSPIHEALPPGFYTITFFSQSRKLGEKQVSIKEDEETQLVEYFESLEHKEP